MFIQENARIINIYNKKEYIVLSCEGNTVKVQDKEGNYYIMAVSDVKVERNE